MSNYKKKSNNQGFVYNIKKHAYVYLLMLPAILLVFVFSYLPLTGVIMAFKDFDISKGIFSSPWVGFENFKVIFTYPNMIRAILNTLLYGVVILFGTMPFTIILALLFNEIKNMHFKKIVQTVSYMPYFLSWISVIGLIYSFCATEGPLNEIISKFAGVEYEPTNILMNSKCFLPVMYISHMWKNIGWSSVIFLAAIAGIDPTLYEAATVDGCGKLQQVKNITLPCISGTIIIVLIMSLGTLVSTNFEQVYGLQNVFTQDDTEVINTLIYRQGIQNGKYSLATAFGLSQGIVSLTLLLIANGLSKKVADISIW